MNNLLLIGASQLPSDSRSISGKQACLVFLAVLVSGCQIQRDVARQLETARLTAEYLFFFDEDKSLLERQTVLDIPTATLGYKSHRKDNEIPLKLKIASQTEHQWVGHDKSVISTSHGRILRTGGLGLDLTQQVLKHMDPLENAEATDWSQAFANRIVDYDAEIGIGYDVHCSFEANQTQQIEVIGTSHDVLLVVESCRVDAIRWRFENKFWIDGLTGFVWMSEQWTHPLQKSPVQLRTLRPSAEDPAWRNHLIRQALAAARQ